jgi:hydroxyacylglutathione hydrolase
MRVVAVPCLLDNYAYLVVDGERAAVVDPGEAAPIEEALARERLQLVAIWLTHHHHDHVGGVAALVAARAKLDVVAHVRDRDRIPHVTCAVDDGDAVALDNVPLARIIYNPGHTLGAISYWLEHDAAVFTGDTLFASGCGKVFEGTAAQMHASLARLAALPPETRVYFGHEYTAKNLRFAATAEPDTAAIAARTAALRVPSTPSTIADELATNPFVRAPDVETFARLRASKDRFR